VGIRQSGDMKSVSYKDILVDLNEQNQIVIHIGTLVKYDLINWKRIEGLEGRRVEVKLSGNHTWYLDFKSLNKVF